MKKHRIGAAALALLMILALAVPALATDSNRSFRYTDAASVSSWALDAVRWANAEGLIIVRTDTTLVPRGNATRAEVATILMRFCNMTEKG